MISDAFPQFYIFILALLPISFGALPSLDLCKWETRGSENCCQSLNPERKCDVIQVRFSASIVHPKVPW